MSMLYRKITSYIENYLKFMEADAPQTDKEEYIFRCPQSVSAMFVGL